MPSGSLRGSTSPGSVNSRDSTSSVSTASRRVAIADAWAWRKPEARERAAYLRSAEEAPRSGPERITA